MANFTGCIAVLIFLLGTFSAIGLGPILILQPQTKLRALKYPILLSPLIGCVLLYAVGLIKIVCLLPLEPLASIAALLILSIILVTIRLEHVRVSWEAFSTRQHVWLLIPGILFVLFFSFIFHCSGFELLSASEDEYQYCADATHMLWYQNKGVPEDSPVPRIDHWLHDWVTKMLCYTTVERHDQILLSSTMALTNLSAFRAFPALCGVMITILIWTAGAIANDCMRLDTKRTFLLQTGFGALFYLLVLHLQGSLANLSSIPCYIASAALLNLGLNPRSHWGLTTLLGILIGGSILFYPDVASFGIVIPAIVVLGETLITSRKERRGGVVRKFAVVCTVALLVSTHSCSTLFPKVFFNIDSLQQRQPESQKRAVWDFIQAPLAADFGVCSYYDDSPAEVAVDALLSNCPERMCCIAAILYMVALYGLVKSGRRCRGLFVPFVLLCLMFGPLLNAQDALRAPRALGYSIPYLLLGLVLATRQTRKVSVFPVLSGIVVLVFLSLNLFAQVRTVGHIIKTSLRTDKLILRLNPVDQDWVRLRQELSKYPTIPVLISGFHDTPRPHRIVSAIEPHPNVLGSSITSFWRILETREDWLQHEPRLAYRNHSVPLRDLAKWQWSVDYPRMICQARQAVVPTGGRFPVEWENWHDVLPAYRTRYTNVCDVVYKERKAFCDDRALGPLGRDEAGVFRVLTQRWRPRLWDDRFAVYVLTVMYEGTPSELILEGLAPAASLAATRQHTKGVTKVEIPVRSFDFGHLELVPVGKPVKLRGIELLEFRLDSQ